MLPETKTATEVTVSALTQWEGTSIFGDASNKGRDNFTASLRPVNPPTFFARRTFYAVG